MRRHITVLPPVSRGRTAHVQLIYAVAFVGAVIVMAQRCERSVGGRGLLLFRRRGRRASPHLIRSSRTSAVAPAVLLGTDQCCPSYQPKLLPPPPTADSTVAPKNESRVTAKAQSDAPLS